MTIDSTRIQVLNTADIRDGAYVLYWMQQSQRVEYNHALEYAVQQANRLERMLLVVFGLMDDYPEANLRHYTFMLEGLKETAAALALRGIKMVLQLGHPAEIALALGGRAAVIVCDRGYLRHQRAWRRQVARQAPCRVVQVESDVVVPVGVVSDKAEYAARTIRPKIQRHLEDYLVELEATKIQHPSLDLNIDGVDVADTERLLSELRLDRSVPSVSRFFAGGTSQARRRFDTFVRTRLKHYDHNSNQPQTDDISHMGPYLHFGQISPLYLALQIRKASDSLKTAKDAYLEELVVRRELAMNFVAFTPNYDDYACIPGWAEKSLADHRHDGRETVYSRRQLESAGTHDPYWNAAMQEMKQTGFMHNYMRMYWGKKILEWSKTPQHAFRTTLAINNRYFLDGRDPNSCAGVAWIYGVHDRAWAERPIFGKIRFMAASGLERKCDIAAYVKKVDDLVQAPG
ncbi:deoxyribodipyrimidine photo-lyase [Desulfosarcina sp.]|uniref:deoxyribodipyrimidine photo-lyase n=1 Tax=Desulfosarcina sp. TaxID=2027861 RepID=UPI003970BACF